LNNDHIHLQFYGPFILCGNDGSLLYKEEISQRAGIYLWSVNIDDGFLVDYIGETGQSFSQRMKDHMIQCLGGNYRIWEPLLFSQGKKELIWNGLWKKEVRDCMPDFVDNYIELAPKIKEYLELIRVFVAPFETTTRIRRRIEGAIASSLREQPSPIGTFFENDIRYNRRSVDEQPIEVSTSCSHRILGLKANIFA
jgi:hypothetical protein